MPCSCTIAPHETVGVVVHARQLGLGGGDRGDRRRRCGSGVGLGGGFHRRSSVPVGSPTTDPDSGATRNSARIPQCPSPDHPSRPPGRRGWCTEATSASTRGSGCASATTPRCSRTSKRRTPTPRDALAHLASLRERALRRDRRTRPGDRHDRAGPSRRLRVLHPHARRPPVRRALPSPGDRRPAPRSARRAGIARRRARGPRRERARRRPRLLRGGRSRRRPRPDASRRTAPTPAAASVTTCASATSTATAGDPSSTTSCPTSTTAWRGRTTARTIFYTRPDEAMRPWQIWRHTLGTPPDDDRLVFQEDDDRFYVSVGRTRSGRFLVITSASKVTTRGLAGRRRRPRPRRRRSSSRASRGTSTTSSTTRARSATASTSSPTPTGRRTSRWRSRRSAHRAARSWTTVLPHRDDTRLDDVDAFAGFLVVSERADAVERLRVLTLGDDGAVADDHVIAMPDEVYSAWLGGNPEYDVDAVRYQYTSLVMPASAYDYDPATRTATPGEAPAGAGLRPRAVREPPGLGDRARRHAGPDLDRLPARAPDRRPRPDAALRLRLVRGLDRPDVLGVARQPPRPGGRVRDRPRPRRRRAGASLVRRRQAPAQDEHVHRLRRLRRPPGRRGLDQPRPPGRPRRQRRRAAHGRGGQPPARPLPRRRGRGAVRRLPHHHPRRDPPPHDHRVGGVGRSGPRPRRLRRS